MRSFVGPRKMRKIKKSNERGHIIFTNGLGGLSGKKRGTGSRI